MNKLDRFSDINKIDEEKTYQDLKDAGLIDPKKLDRSKDSKYWELSDKEKIQYISDYADYEISKSKTPEYLKTLSKELVNKFKANIQNKVKSLGKEADIETIAIYTKKLIQELANSVKSNVYYGELPPEIEHHGKNDPRFFSKTTLDLSDVFGEKGGKKVIDAKSTTAKYLLYEVGLFKGEIPINVKSLEKSPTTSSAAGWKDAISKSKSQEFKITPNLKKTELGENEVKISDKTNPITKEEKEKAILNIQKKLKNENEDTVKKSRNELIDLLNVCKTTYNNYEKSFNDIESNKYKPKKPELLEDWKKTGEDLGKMVSKLQDIYDDIEKTRSEFGRGREYKDIFDKNRDVFSKAKELKSKYDILNKKIELTLSLGR
jgi:hypothetical protein